MSTTDAPIRLTGNFTLHPDAPARERARFFSRRRRALISLRDDGSVFTKTLTEGWTQRTEPATADQLDARLTKLDQWCQSVSGWPRHVQDIPTLDDLEQQLRDDGAVETPTGASVEPDGIGPDGVPSWLRVFGLI